MQPLRLTIFANHRHGPRNVAFFLAPGRYRFSLEPRGSEHPHEAWEYARQERRWINEFYLYSAGASNQTRQCGNGVRYATEHEAFAGFQPFAFEVTGNFGWPMMAYIGDLQDTDNRGCLNLFVERL